MRMVAAGIRALGIHRAQTCLAIKVEAIAIGEAGQREDAALLVEVFDDPGFAQTFGNVLRWFVTLEGIDQFQANQVIDAHFDGHRAAGRLAIAAQSVAVASPCFQAVRVGRSDYSCLHGAVSVMAARDHNHTARNFQRIRRVERRTDGHANSGETCKPVCMPFPAVARRRHEPLIFPFSQLHEVCP